MSLYKAAEEAPKMEQMEHDETDDYLTALKEDLSRILATKKDASGKNVVEKLQFPSTMPKRMKSEWCKTVQRCVEEDLLSFVWLKWDPAFPSKGVDLHDHAFKSWHRRVCEHLVQLGLPMKFVNAKGRLCVEKFGANALMDFVKQTPTLNIWNLKGQQYIFPNLVHKILYRYPREDIEYAYKAFFAPDLLTASNLALGFGSQAQVCDGCEMVRTVGMMDLLDTSKWVCHQCFQGFYGMWPWDEYGLEHIKEVVQQHFVAADAPNCDIGDSSTHSIRAIFLLLIGNVWTALSTDSGGSRGMSRD